MSRFGWAYVNDVITGSGGTPGGSDKAIQFASGSTFSGSTNFTYNYLSNSLAQGSGAVASGIYSHAEGLDTTTYGNYSHAEGAATITYGVYSHAEGSITRASASYSHAEGRLTWTYGIGSHAEGLSTTTYGEASHAEGYNTIASGNYSHAEGIGTIASGSGQTVVGTYNIGNSSSLFIIGNGASNASRSDIFLVNTGSVIVSGNLNVTGGIKGGYATYSSNTSIPNTSYFVGLNSVSSVLTASLLAATNYPQGQTLIFKDIGGYAGTNNILVQASGSETIDGASGVSLTTNSSSVSIISNGSNGFYIVGIV